jgi:hypothetical protein
MMNDMKQAPANIELDDAWLRSLGGQWVQMEFDEDYIRFVDGERVMMVYTDRSAVKVWMPGKPEANAAVLFWIKTRADFAWACQLFAFQIDGVR